MTRGHIAARMLRPLAWHHMDLRGRLMWLAMLPVLIFATVWGVYVLQCIRSTKMSFIQSLNLKTKWHSFENLRN